MVQEATALVQHIYCGQLFLETKTFPYHLLRVDKRRKVTLVAFAGLASLKGQVLDDIFKFKELGKIEMTTQVTIGKREYQVTVNCNIHLSK